MSTAHLLICPHCKGMVQVMEDELNCRIFRHGSLRDSGAQMNPHETKDQCDSMASSHRIWGCGKPFRVVELRTDR